MSITLERLLDRIISSLRDGLNDATMHNTTLVILGLIGQGDTTFIGSVFRCTWLGALQILYNLTSSELEQQGDIISQRLMTEFASEINEALNSPTSASEFPRIE